MHSEAAAPLHPGIAAAAGDVRGDLTLADFVVSSASAAAGLIAGIAATLDDLHATGHAHGQLSAAMIVIDRSQRPIIVWPSSTATDTGQDVRQVGDLIDLLLQRLPSDVRTTRSARRLTEVADEIAAGTLDDAGTVAERCTAAANPGNQSSIRSVVTLLGRGRRIAAPMTICVVTVAAAALASRSPEPSGPASIGAGYDTGRVALAEADRRVEHDGEILIVAQPGDAVAVGDWNCDGIATPAALRPSTGEVFVWSSWSSDPQRAVALAPGADGFLVVGDAACGSIGLTSPEQTMHIPISPAPEEPE